MPDGLCQFLIEKAKEIDMKRKEQRIFQQRRAETRRREAEEKREEEEKQEALWKEEEKRRLHKEAVGEAKEAIDRLWNTLQIPDIQHFVSFDRLKTDYNDERMEMLGWYRRFPEDATEKANKLNKRLRIEYLLAKESAEARLRQEQEQQKRMNEFINKYLEMYLLARCFNR